MTNPLRTKSATAKVTDEEYQQFEAAAKARGLTTSEWCREALLARLNSGQATQINSEQIASTDMAILSELLGVRMLLLNLLYPVGRGESLSAEKVQAIVTRADAEKLSAAIQCLEQNAKRRN
ncbi:MAG TPA: hypothetical protein VN176_09685 [Verrucomicrobiae bacterium]|nr:hypothetical protein [Verrucomicrobiae bacterium]